MANLDSTHSGRGTQTAAPTAPSGAAAESAGRPGAPAVVLRPVVLVVGPEELLAERAVEAIEAEVRASRPQAEMTDLDGTTFDVGRFLELVSPSLFGEDRVIVVRGLPAAGAQSRALEEYVADPSADVVLVLVHDGGARGKKVLDIARGAGAREISCARLTRYEERVDFVRAEVAAAGGRADAPAARAILEAVGPDLRELSAVSRQLAFDSGAVARYHRGKADVKGWTVADRAIEGRRPAAMEELRWALSIGTEPVLIVSALATGLRSIARVGARRQRSEAVIAKELGMPPWKVRNVKRQLDGWTPDGIEQALTAVAQADADVKGASAHPAYALERAVAAICAARAR